MPPHLSQTLQLKLLLLKKKLKINHISEQICQLIIKPNQHQIQK